MDTQTGEVLTPKQMETAEKFLMSISGHTIAQELHSRLKPMAEPPTLEQLRRIPPEIKGHERCPCGSGKLFKNCCMKNDVGRTTEQIK